MKLTYTVYSKLGRNDFVLRIRPAHSPQEFHLHPIEFYQNWVKKIPHGRHHELEILKPDQSFFVQHKVEVARSRLTKKPFVSYPYQLHDLSHVIGVVKLWCLGAVLAITTKIQIEKVFDECKRNFDYLELMLKKCYGIWAERLRLKGPMLYPLTREQIECYENPETPWEYHGYSTAELADYYPAECVPSAIEREDNILVLRSGMIYTDEYWLSFQTQKQEFRIGYQYVKNLRNGEGSPIWINQNGTH